MAIMAVRDGDYGCDDCDGCGDGDGVLFWNSETSRGRSGRALSHNFGSTTVTHLILLAQGCPATESLFFLFLLIYTRITPVRGLTIQ